MIRETDIDKLKITYPIKRNMTIRTVEIDLLQSVDGVIDDLIEIRDSVDENQELELNVWSSYDTEDVESEVRIQGVEDVDAYEERILRIRNYNITFNKQDFDRYLEMKKQYGDGSFIKNFK